MLEVSLDGTDFVLVVMWRRLFLKQTWGSMRAGHGPNGTAVWPGPWMA